jgi:hypothetical protein
MRKFRAVISVVLVLTVLALTGCANIFKSKPVENTSSEIPTDDHDGWDGVQEYTVSKYEVNEGAFETTGDLKLYRYEEVEGAENVIDVFNSYYNIDLKVDEETKHENGYGNWFWENGDSTDIISAAVSMSSKTGKFSFSYSPGRKAVESASKAETPEDNKWDEKVTEFVNKFEFVTGKLTLDSSSPYNDMYYPFIAEGQEDTEDIQVKGRRYLFVSSDYSKQKVEAQDGLNCYVECGDSDITNRDTQYFVVTVFNDGTIVSANNYITKANIVSDGTEKMIDESSMDKLLVYFSSTTEDDTMVLTRAYVCSYSNYFGYPEITPAIKVEYYYKSNPSDVQATEIMLQGFYD